MNAWRLFLSLATLSLLPACASCSDRNSQVFPITPNHDVRNQGQPISPPDPALATQGTRSQPKGAPSAGRLPEPSRSTSSSSTGTPQPSRETAAAPPTTAAKICQLVANNTWPLGQHARDTAIRSYYEDHQCQPLFHHGQQLAAKGLKLAQRLGNLAHDGLNPRDFGYPAIYTRIQQPSQDSAAALDVLLTQAAVRLAWVLGGEDLAAQASSQPPQPKTWRTINGIKDTTAINQHLDRYAPATGPYRRLRGFLEHQFSASNKSQPLATPVGQLIAQQLAYWRRHPEAALPRVIIINRLTNQARLLSHGRILWQDQWQDCQWPRADGQRYAFAGISHGATHPRLTFKPPLPCRGPQRALGLLAAVSGGLSYAPSRLLQQQLASTGVAEPSADNPPVMAVLATEVAWLDQNDQLTLSPPPATMSAATTSTAPPKPRWPKT